MVGDRFTPGSLTSGVINSGRRSRLISSPKRLASGSSQESWTNSKGTSSSGSGRPSPPTRNRVRAALAEAVQATALQTASHCMRFIDSVSAYLTRSYFVSRFGVHGTSHM